MAAASKTKTVYKVPAKVTKSLDSAKKSLAKARERAKEHGFGVVGSSFATGLAVGYAIDRKGTDGKSLVPERFMTEEGKADSGWPTIPAAAILAGGWVVMQKEKNPYIQGVAAGLAALAGRDLGKGDGTRK